MMTLELHGKITEKGELIVELPLGLPVGEVTVRLDVPEPEKSADWENQPWTDEEIKELMTLKPMPMDEFLAWLDANQSVEPWGDIRDDEDAGDYVHRMRRQAAIS